MSGAGVYQPCAAIGCANPASRYPRVLMVGEGFQRGDHEPLALMLPIAVCPRCQDEFDPQQWLGEEARSRLIEALRRKTNDAPDFDNAWVEWSRIGDRYWIAEMARQGQGATRQ